jgi:hypothetical protein
MYKTCLNLNILKPQDQNTLVARQDLKLAVHSVLLKVLRNPLPPKEKRFNQPAKACQPIGSSVTPGHPVTCKSGYASPSETGNKAKKKERKICPSLIPNA